MGCGCGRKKEVVTSADLAMQNAEAQAMENARLQAEEAANQEHANPSRVTVS